MGIFCRCNRKREKEAIQERQARRTQRLEQLRKLAMPALNAEQFDKLLGSRNVGDFERLPSGQFNAAIEALDEKGECAWAQHLRNRQSGEHYQHPGHAVPWHWTKEEWGHK